MAHKLFAIRHRIIVRTVETSFCLLLTCYVAAQSKVRGIVLNNNGDPLVNASVMLLNSNDSSLIKGIMTIKEGRFSFDKVASGSYLVASTFVGYNQAYSPVFIAKNETIELSPLTLSQAEAKLSNVTVTARKPLIEQTADRLVINVANNITAAGSTALDILERSPGVLVDRQNYSLSINGKDGVVVMINGKISRMPLASVVQMLAGMPADKIEKVELITTPPASLDAEGNAGYINIVLKESSQYGTNGSYAITAGYSRGGIGSGTININHRKNRMNLYGNYTYSISHIPQYFTLYHAVTNQGVFLENYTDSKRLPTESYHDGKIGLDYELNKKTIIGGLVTFYYRRWTMDATNNSKIFSNQQLDTTINLLVHEFHPTSSYDVNVNLQQTYKEGNKLTVNLDYMYYMDRNPVSYNNTYYDAEDKFVRTEEVNSNKTTPIHLWIAAIDYTQNLSKEFFWEAGAKTIISHFNNDVKIERLQGTDWTTDNQLTANYDLDESIFAAYSSLRWVADKKTNMKLGLRYEYTNSNLGTEKVKNIVDRHYGNLFPSFFLSHSFDDNNTANFSYSRRITRPTFWNLAPFVIFMDPNTFFSGNPGLQPSISDNVNLSYTYKSKILSLAYSYEADPITNFSPTIDSVTNKETLAAANQDNRQTVTVSLLLPVTVSKWWNMQLNVSGSFQEIKGWYNEAPLSIDNKNLLLSGQQNFILPKEFTFSLSGFYRSAGLFGIYKTKGFGSLDAGLQKKFAKIRSTLRLNWSNVFNTLIIRPEINQPDKNLITTGELIFTHPAVKLTYTHSFGNDKVKTSRTRSLGNEDEKDRLKQQ